MNQHLNNSSLQHKVYSQPETRLDTANKVVKVVIFIFLVPVPPDMRVEKPAERKELDFTRLLQMCTRTQKSRNRTSSGVPPEVLQSEGGQIKVPRLLVDHEQLLQGESVLSGLQQRLHGLLSELTASGFTLQRQHQLHTRLQILQVQVTHLKSRDALQP